MPLRTAQARLAVLTAYADREELGEIQAEANAAMNERRLELARDEPRSSGRSERQPIRAAQRGREGHLAARSSPTCSPTGARRRRTSTRRCASAGSSACSGPIATPMPSSYHAATSAACRRSRRLHEGARDRRSASPRSTRSGSTSPATRTSAPTSRTGRRRRRAPCVIAVRPAVRRPPDHARPGRAARLPGVPARGGARAPLRRLRSRPPVHVPRAVARPRADRDLLASSSSRSRASRAGTRRTSGSRTRRRRENAEATTFLDTLLFRRYVGEAPLRDRLLVALRRGRRHGGRLLRAADGRDRATSTAPTGTSRTWTPGFYSADYLRAWIRSAQLADVPPPRGRRGLVAEPRDRRSPPRAVRGGHPPDARGGRRAARLRPARHCAARRRAQPLSFAFPDYDDKSLAGYVLWRSEEARGAVGVAAEGVLSEGSVRAVLRGVLRVRSSRVEPKADGKNLAAAASMDETAAPPARSPHGPQASTFTRARRGGARPVLRDRRLSLRGCRKDRSRTAALHDGCGPRDRIRHRRPEQGDRQHPRGLADRQPVLRLPLQLQRRRRAGQARTAAASTCASWATPRRSRWRRPSRPRESHDAHPDGSFHVETAGDAPAPSFPSRQNIPFVIVAI